MRPLTDTEIERAIELIAGSGDQLLAEAGRQDSVDGMTQGAARELAVAVIADNLGVDATSIMRIVVDVRIVQELLVKAATRMPLVHSLRDGSPELVAGDILFYVAGR